jgi:MFS family permease
MVRPPPDSDESALRPSGPAPAAAFAGFAVFGLFWGVWGASLPALRDAAGVDDAQLGIALLFVGLGALPAMAVTGRLVDRLGVRIASPLLLALGIAGLAPVLLAGSLPALCGCILLIGATSGAADVALNSLAGASEHGSGRPVITRAHAAFSASVVVGSLGTGAVRTLGVPSALPFAAVPAVALVVALMVAGPRTGPARPVDAAVPTPAGAATARPRAPRPLLWLLLPVGLVGAAAFAVENAHQSWSAVFLGDELGASPLLTAAAPATFAAVAAIARFAAGLVDLDSGHRATVVLAGGASTAAVGTLVVAVAPGVPVALAGLVLAAAGTAVLFPVLLSTSTRTVPTAFRGRATSAVGTTAYLGFLLGPVGVGAVAGAADGGLRAAMVAVAGLAVVVAVLAGPVAARARRRVPAVLDVAPAVG